MNVEPVQIVEVLERTVQGVTRPYLCRGDDGCLYYVKGIGAGRRGQLCEWTAGHLAKALGLPIADFRVVQLPQELVQLDSQGLDIRELGTGPAFASAQVHAAQEFMLPFQDRVEARLRQEILVFDYWIRNADRTLTELGGNPNLLWNTDDDCLNIIDHNLAFDNDFSPADFLETHVFREQRRFVFDDLLRRGEWQDWLETALPAWGLACESAPEEWWFLDAECSILANFDKAAIEARLNLCKTMDFWDICP